MHRGAVVRGVSIMLRSPCGKAFCAGKWGLRACKLGGSLLYHYVRPDAEVPQSNGGGGEAATGGARTSMKE